jgi:beta-catenin-like protein 1
VLYSEAIKNEVPASLCALLSHENEDIVAAVVTLIEELTDDDVLEGVEGDMEAAEAAMTRLVDSLVSALAGRLLNRRSPLTERSILQLANQLLDLLLSNLDRFLALVNKSGRDERSEADEQAVYHVFAALENLVNLRSEVAVSLGSNKKFVNKLLTLINNKGEFDANKGYAAELLAVLSQHSSADGRTNVKIIGQQSDAIEGLLKGLSVYRKSDPVDGEEDEFTQNLFDALCALLADDANKKIFLDAEGVELMVIMTKTKLSARLRAFKVLDHATSGPGGKAACTRFVDSLGLKSLFQMLMAKVSEPICHI